MKDLITILQHLTKKNNIKSSDHLKNDLNLESMKLVELVVIVNETWGIDLGLMAMKGLPVETVEDLQKILKEEK